MSPQQVATITDPLNHTTTFACDDLGRLTSVTDPLSHQTTFTYNAAAQPLTVTDALSKDDHVLCARQLVSISSPLGHVESRFVDGAGRLIQVKDAMGAATRFEYNAFDQVTRIVDPLDGKRRSRTTGTGSC